jgi:hypothetical protein
VAVDDAGALGEASVWVGRVAAKLAP